MPNTVGDLMVTSGAGGYYRPGVAVAIIAKITPDGGIGRLIAEPGATNFVAVEPIAQAAAVDALQSSELPSPKPSASPKPAAPASAAAPPSPDVLEMAD